MPPKIRWRMFYLLNQNFKTMFEDTSTVFKEVKSLKVGTAVELLQNWDLIIERKKEKQFFQTMLNIFDLKKLTTTWSIKIWNQNPVRLKNNTVNIFFKTFFPCWGIIIFVAVFSQISILPILQLFSGDTTISWTVSKRYFFSMRLIQYWALII